MATSSAKTTQTKLDVKFREEICDSGVECDPSYEYTAWGEWSECPSCIKSIERKPMKYRYRQCKPFGCISGTKEEQQCTFINFCPLECPNFRISSIEKDKNEETQMAVNFTMDKAEVFYGKWKKQKVSLQQINSDGSFKHDKEDDYYVVLTSTRKVLL